MNLINWQGVGRRCASMKIAVVVPILIAVGALLANEGLFSHAWGVGVPLLLFAVNVTAALVQHGKLRGDGVLATFHMALLAIVVLAALGRASYFDGWVRLILGNAFDGRPGGYESGPLHAWHLDKVRFVNLGFDHDYAANGNLRGTYNRLLWTDDTGQDREGVIGDDRPLEIQGYRFYTSKNWGFAPVFFWSPHNGQGEHGAVFLPAYLGNVFRQAMAWDLPGSGLRLWVMLEIEDVLLDPVRRVWTPGLLPEKHHLIVRYKDMRQILAPGEAILFPEGVLRYQFLSSWMGYRIHSDWTVRWMLAACLMAVFSGVWFYGRKFYGKPWLQR